MTLKSRARMTSEDRQFLLDSLPSSIQCLRHRSWIVSRPIARQLRTWLRCQPDFRYLPPVARHKRKAATFRLAQVRLALSGHVARTHRVRTVRHVTAPRPALRCTARVRQLPLPKRNRARINSFRALTPNRTSPSSFRPTSTPTSGPAAPLTHRSAFQLHR